MDESHIDHPPKDPLRRHYLPHFEGRGAPIFVTFCTKNRWILPPQTRPLVLEHILHDHHVKFRLICAVVMPDHAHMLYVPFGNSEEGTQFKIREIMNGIKGASAHSINRALGRRGAVWQRDAFDHVVRKIDSIEDKIDYILTNPVRAGLCKVWEEYPYLWRGWEDA